MNYPWADLPGPTHPGPVPIRLWLGRVIRLLVTMLSRLGVLKSQVTKVIEEAMSPQANHPGKAGAEAWG